MSRPQIAADKIFVDQSAEELFDKLKADPASEITKRTRKALTKPFTGTPIEKERLEVALNAEDSTAFKEIIAEIPRDVLFLIHRINELQTVALQGSAISDDNHDVATSQLKEFVGTTADGKYQGICTVKTAKDSREIGSENSARVFPIHSIGKVFTGVLIAEMVASGQISQDDLNKPGLPLDEDVKAKLPPQIRDLAQKVTLHQAMTHTAGFGDYLGTYIGKIDDAIKSNGEIPSPTKPEDFLQYADAEIVDIQGGAKSYSNLGILIAGLAAQHCYNRNKPAAEQKPYDKILEELVLTPATIENFSVSAPAGAMAADGLERQVNGSPAGGYWTNAENMQKFGDHLCRRFNGDEKFRAAVLEYGQEFYNEKDETIGHAGELDSSAWFSVHLPSGTTCITAQNSMVAGITGEQVSHVIANEQREMTQSRGEEQSVSAAAGDDQKPKFLRKILEQGKSKAGQEQSFAAAVENRVGTETQRQ